MISVDHTAWLSSYRFDMSVVMVLGDLVSWHSITWRCKQLLLIDAGKGEIVNSIL